MEIAPLERAWLLATHALLKHPRHINDSVWTNAQEGFTIYSHL